MGPKNVFAAILAATLVAWSGMSVADEYRPGEFLSLDLSKAVLSPKPLGPATQFAPVRIEARAERANPAPSTARRARYLRQSPESRSSASARGKTAGCGSHEAGATARQSARRPGVRYAGSGLAVQVRRHLQLEVSLHRRDQAPAHQGATSR